MSVDVGRSRAAAASMSRAGAKAKKSRGGAVVGALVVGAVSALFLALPGGTGAPEAAMTGATDGFAFEPESIEIDAGDSVTFVNESRRTHTAICEGCATDTGDVQPGLERTVRFSRAGTFTIFCRYHREAGMEMKVTVS